MENSSLIDEAINLEQNVSQIYIFFSTLFEEDKEFWWQLAFEELNHAALIESGKKYFDKVNQFPKDLILDNLQTLKRMNNELRSIITNIMQNPPSRKEAFKLALKLEESATELHFQQFMTKETNLIQEKVFQQLNKDDKDHAIRIRSYMESIK